MLTVEDQRTKNLEEVDKIRAKTHAGEEKTKDIRADIRKTHNTHYGKKAKKNVSIQTENPIPYKYKRTKTREKSKIFRQFG